MSAYLALRARPILLADDATALRAAAIDQLEAGQLVHLATGDHAGWLVKWDPDETAADDDERYFTPDSITEPAPGRYVTYAATTAIPNALALRDNAGALPDAGAASPDFADPVLHVNVGGAPPTTGLYGISVNVTTGAARKGMYWAPDKSAWVAAEDTLGDDATLSNYLAFRALSLQANFFQSNAVAGVSSTGAVRLGVAEEVKGVVSGTDYRLAAMLAGPVVALGDTNVTTTTLDSATTLTLKSRLGTVNALAATTFNVKDAAGSNTYFQTDTATGITKALPRFMVYDAVGTLVVLDVNAGTPAILVGGRIDTTAATPLGPLTLGGGNATYIANRIDGIGTAETTGWLLTNETAAAAGLQQRSGYLVRRGYGWKTTATAASVMVEVGDQLRPVQGGSAPSAQWYFGYRIPGGTGSWSTYFFCDNNNSSFGVCVTANTFVTSAGGNGYRLSTNGGGVKETGGGRALFQSAASGEPWEALSSTSTGNTGGRFQFTADAGVPSAGYLARFGYGSGSFSVQVFGLYYDGRLQLANVAPAALGEVGMNTTSGRLLCWATSSGATAASRPVALQAEVQWTHQATAVDRTTAVGELNEVDTTAAVNITLPAIPSGVSERAADVVVLDSTGNAGVQNITITAAGSNTIKGGASITIAAAYGARVLKHNGVAGASGKWFVVGGIVP